MNCVSIGSVNGLSPVRCQSITPTNADLWSVGPRLIVNWTLRNKLQWSSNQNKKNLHSRKCISEYRLWNGDHFFQGWVRRNWWNVLGTSFLSNCYSIRKLLASLLRRLNLQSASFQLDKVSIKPTGLTHSGRDKWPRFPDDFLNAFSWMKMNSFRLRFHWSLFPRVQLTIFHPWFR